MKLSIIIPVLDSHEIVRRQVIHFGRLARLDKDVEVMLVDDGSEPPIPDYYGITVIKTNDKRPWTQPKARNMGAKEAKGENLLFTDIDHIVTKDAIEFGKTMKYDYARFRRELAVLQGDGSITQDRGVLVAYGIPTQRSLRISCHTLSMIIKRDVFEQTGGFREKLGSYPTHDDGNMKRALKRFKKCPDNNPDERPLIYMIPNGRYCGDKNSNPFNLFHKEQR